jgi:hypothetical protein
MYTPILVSNDHIVQELYLHLEVAPVLLTSSRFLENNGSTLFSVRTETTRTSTMNISFSPTSRVIRRNLDSGRAAGATLLDTWGIKWRKGCDKIIFISVSNHMCTTVNRGHAWPCSYAFITHATKNLMVVVVKLIYHRRHDHEMENDNCDLFPVTKHVLLLVL